MSSMMCGVIEKPVSGWMMVLLLVVLWCSVVGFGFVGAIECWMRNW